MTHEELLQEIMTEFGGASIFGGSENIYKALRAVVELHKPNQAWVNNYLHKDSHLTIEKCYECNIEYPCPSIQAIEKELK